MIPESLQPCASMTSLIDLLDFSRKNFDKHISLSPKKNNTIDTQWDLVKLGDVCDVIAGQSPESEHYNEERKGLPFYQGKKDFGDIYLKNPVVWTTKTTKESIKNDILMSVRAPVGDVNINPFEKICIGRGLAAIRSNGLSLQKYLFEFISHNQFLFKGDKKSTFDSISTNDLREIKISLPPLEIQTKVVQLCEAIDTEAEKAELDIGEAKAEIKNIISNLNSYQMEKIESICSNWDSKRKPVTRSDRMKGEYPYYGASGIVDYVSDYLIDDTVLLVSEDGANLKSRVTPIAFTATGKIWVNNHAHILKFRNKNMHKLTEIYLNHLDLDGYITGMAQPKLSQNNLNRIKIPVPDLATQQQLIIEIEAHEISIIAAQKIIDEAATKKQAILKQYL